MLTATPTVELILGIVQAIGAVGTAIAAIVALLQLRHAVATYRSNLDRQAAARIRGVVEKLRTDVHKLFVLVNDDVPSLIGASAIAKEFESRLGPSPTAEMFWNRLENPAFLHSVVVEGWESADQVSQFRETVEEVQRTRDQLQTLPLLQHAAELLVIICRHSSSSFSLSRQTLRKSTLHNFFEPYMERSNVTDLVDRLNTYFVGQTHNFAGEKDSIVDTIEFLYQASEEVLALPDNELFRLTRKKSPGLSFFGITYEAALDMALTTIEQSVEEAADFLSESTYSNLLAEVEEIRNHATIEHAVAGAERLGAILKDEHRDELYLPSVSYSNPEMLPDGRATTEVHPLEE